MPGELLDKGATVQCQHGGKVQPSSAYERVKLDGQFVLTQPSTYSVSGCTLPPPIAANGPCVTAQWTSAAKRVKAGGEPVLLQDSQAQCIPTGTGVTVRARQTKVKGK